MAAPKTQHLYVIHFSSGIVKVGRTGTPSARFTALAQPLRPHGIYIDRCWISGSYPLLQAKRLEWELIALCVRDFTCVNAGEYFKGVSPEEVIQLAEALVEDGTLAFFPYHRTSVGV